MGTHQRLAPCPAALEDRELGPSTGMEEEIEDSGGRDGVEEGERRYGLGRLVGLCARHREIFYMRRSRGSVGDFPVCFLSGSICNMTVTLQPDTLGKTCLVDLSKVKLLLKSIERCKKAQRTRFLFDLINKNLMYFCLIHSNGNKSEFVLYVPPLTMASHDT